MWKHICEGVTEIIPDRMRLAGELMLLVGFVLTTSVLVAR